MTTLQEIYEMISKIQWKDEEPGLIILNEKDYDKLQSRFNPEAAIGVNSMFGIKLLIIPSYLGSFNLLALGEVIVLEKSVVDFLEDNFKNG